MSDNLLDDFSVEAIDLLNDVADALLLFEAGEDQKDCCYRIL